MTLVQLSCLCPKEAAALSSAQQPISLPDTLLPPCRFRFSSQNLLESSHGNRICADSIMALAAAQWLASSLRRSQQKLNVAFALLHAAGLQL